MQLLFYNLSIQCYRWGIKLASLFNAKARLFVQGRKGWQKRIKNITNGKQSHALVWFHCSSLGEFEQGRPIIEEFRKQFPQYKILLTFFSPSGYEIRKSYDKVDFVQYLPLDTRQNASTFINAWNPQIVFFIKYEFWYHYAHILHKRNIPLLSVSSIFREEQMFFRWYGGFQRHILKKFSHFFVQNETSKLLLKRIDIHQVSVAGDTRFDRVVHLREQAFSIPLISEFKAGEKLFIAGSTWPEDMEVLSPFINETNEVKFIIAPHEIEESNLEKIESDLSTKSIRFSQMEGLDLSSYKVLLIDNIGMLSALYSYADYAFIGGAFGAGLHNILEAATFGIPILFGNKNYSKFQEAITLNAAGGAFVIKDFESLSRQYEALCNEDEYQKTSEITATYVNENIGATEIIIRHCKTLIDQ